MKSKMSQDIQQDYGKKDVMREPYHDQKMKDIKLEGGEEAKLKPDNDKTNLKEDIDYGTRIYQLKSEVTEKRNKDMDGFKKQVKRDQVKDFIYMGLLCIFIFNLRSLDILLWGSINQAHSLQDIIPKVTTSDARLRSTHVLRLQVQEGRQGRPTLSDRLCLESRVMLLLKNMALR